jgi:hypothetical protein
MSDYENKTEIVKTKKKNAANHKIGHKVTKFKRGGIYGLKKGEGKIMVSTHKEWTTFSPLRPKSLTSSMKLA